MRYVLCFLLVFPAVAVAKNFTCTIKSVTDVDETGMFVSDTDWFTLGKVGEKFSVDGSTGKIIGSEMLANDGSGTPRITKQGEGNSFIALTQHRSGDVSILKIYTYREVMSFLYVATAVGQATGVCKYL